MNIIREVTKFVNICLYVIRKVAGLPNIQADTALGVSGVGGVVLDTAGAFYKGGNDSWAVNNNGNHRNDSSWSLVFFCVKVKLNIWFF